MTDRIVLDRAAGLMDKHAVYSRDCLEWQRARNVGYGVFTALGVRYYCHTEIDAMLALARRAHKDKGEVRQYRCPFCRGWHLTSQHERTT